MGHAYRFGKSLLERFICRSKNELAGREDLLHRVADGAPKRRVKASQIEHRNRLQWSHRPGFYPPSCARRREPGDTMRPGKEDRFAALCLPVGHLRVTPGRKPPSSHREKVPA